jgi:hypothetical protein
MEEIRPSEGEDIKDIWPDFMFSTLPHGYYGRITLGNGNAYDIGMMWVEVDEDRRLLISIIDKGAYTFGGFVHSTYALEKLNILIWDAQNLADFINRQLGLTGKPQGRYEKRPAKTTGVA